MGKGRAAKSGVGWPVLPKVQFAHTNLSKRETGKHDIVLQVTGVHRTRIPYAPEFTASRLRHKLGRDEPALITLPSGTKVVQVPLQRMDRFRSQEQIRKALDMAGAKPGANVAIDIRRLAQARLGMYDSTYAALVYLARMPNFSDNGGDEAVASVRIYGTAGHWLRKMAVACAEANILCRWLCMQPGNVLTPEALVEFCKGCARELSLDFEHIGMDRLEKKGAGAFVAVAGKDSKGGMIRLGYRGRHKPRRKVALVGKGVCFDTGGLNVKNPKGMRGMHADMAGAACSLAAVVAASKLGLRVDVDAWLMVAENLIGPEAMKPGDVVKSMSGKTIEIVDTDAEGRLLLAEGISAAKGTRPDAMVTMATLTGSMTVALGSGMSGITGSPSLVETAILASKECGERLHPFPMPDDYKKGLKSKVADVAQCAVSGEADHIMAALLLRDFTGKVPWLHVDLSAMSSEGGLGAVPTDLTGFGACWATMWLSELVKK